MRIQTIETLARIVGRTIPNGTPRWRVAAKRAGVRPGTHMDQCPLAHSRSLELCMAASSRELPLIDRRTAARKLLDIAISVNRSNQQSER